MPGIGTKPRPKPAWMKFKQGGQTPLPVVKPERKIKIFSPEQERANAATVKAIKGIIGNAKKAADVLIRKK